MFLYANASLEFLTPLEWPVIIKIAIGARDIAGFVFASGKA
ncbi:MAG: hypothetical protein NT123_16265 [Proteobacteria bacterium]|nr:hypothetical protein [Pseudomonadota bacterium]